MEEIEADKLSKEDIDVRLKWLGLFHRRKHQYGRFMMRLKLPNGVTTSEQTRYLASVIEAYGEEGCADVTTRQNWQIRGVTLPDGLAARLLANELVGREGDDVVVVPVYVSAGSQLRGRAPYRRRWEG
ncbi:hypothetical protein GUJ93_ZPchr0006g44626 [Zizania palustris]|uniref:Nitrite/Sulfite reductase ferredoxin-like domain-containing protein n=1 Tax=Zizania palustris TaxID=103762 RepID=A0A8J5SBB3_ZIZPA|nr:hypothetical protein GUJ93_ZPchr0006g44626 [Zizania palustris]